jgi:DNA-binding CsgD family transcriptional regulator/PAS domain-containing protein
MDEQARLDRVIEDVYAGALEVAAWNRAMHGISDLLGCSGGVLFAVNPTSQIVLRDEVYRADPTIMPAYREHWASSDMRIPAGLAAPVGEPLHERQIVDKRLWQRSAILNEFLLPSDVPFFLAAWLHKSPHKVVALSFEGSRRRGPFDDNDSQKLKRLIPHVSQALEIRDRLEAHEVRASALSSVVDRSNVGVIMLDIKGRVLEATGLAEQLLRAEPGMRRASDHTLWLREPAGSQLRQCLISGLPPKGNSGGLISVPRGCGLQSISLAVTPMPAVPVAWTGANPRWLVFVFDPEQRVAPVAASLARDLGISAREAEIAALLSNGHNLRSVAKRLGVSMHTIRTHLKHIFHKTGAHTQSDLVRRVLLSPAMRL